EQLEAVLVVRSGVDGVERVALDKARHVIGRRAPADIVLDNEFVSGRHAEITFDGVWYSIRDLGSKNGTFVDREQVGDRPVVLRPGARIDLGRAAVVLTFQLADATITQTASDFGLPKASAQPSSWLEVRSEARTVFVGGEPIQPPLSPKAFDLLAMLYERRGNACSWAAISARVWPERGGAPVSPGEVAQQVRQIRQRIVDPDGTHPDPISSVQGFGYRLDL
ncbi:MAG: FHA domain-containing protein, partial [Chloroflexi bacterium]|nr:FHA domain-containing protein [Chloroflexota bacterium]